MSRGQRVILESGKRGILSGGSQSLFDASGECAECCGGECPCPHTMTPAREYQVTLSGFDASACGACLVCGTAENQSVYDIVVDVDGTYTIPYVSTTFSRSAYTLFIPAATVTAKNDPFETDCSTPFRPDSSNGTTIAVICDDSDNTIDIQVISRFTVCNTAPLLFLKTGVACLNYGDAPVLLTDAGQMCGFRTNLSGTKSLQVTSGGTVLLEVV